MCSFDSVKRSKFHCSLTIELSVTNTVYMGQFVFTRRKGFISQAIPLKFFAWFRALVSCRRPDKKNLCQNSLTSVVKNIEKSCLKLHNLSSIKF